MKKATQSRTVVRMYVVLLLFLVCGFGVLFFQLFMLQIVRGEELQQRAMNQQTRANILGASRGIIFDRNMNPLAESTTVWNICISPAELDQDTLDHVAGRLAEILAPHTDKERILAAAERRNTFYWVIARGVDRTLVDEVLAFITDPEAPVRGVFTEQTTRRNYRYGRLASSILGFTNSDGDGAYGLEAFYNRVLSGTPGRVVSTRDAKGAPMPLMYSQLYAAEDGNSIVLTIDETVQHFLERHLETAVIEHNIQQFATGIVMNVRTGEILAMATMPDFDPNDPFTLTNPHAIERLSHEREDSDAFIELRQNLRFDQWRNRAISDPYEPGSVFKLITAAVAVDNNLVSLNDQFVCNHVFRVSDTDFHCWQRRGHGNQNFMETMQNSCNPAYIMIGQRIGGGLLYDYIEKFGLREVTGIDLPGEAPGIGHTRAMLSREGRVELASTSFGQSMTVTPIQMITSSAATVNGGYLMEPFVVRQVLDPVGNVIQTRQPTVRRQVISHEASDIMRQLAHAVVADGSGRLSAVPGFEIGGKTGTSQKLDQIDAGHILSFVGFAPMDDPQIAILVTLDEPELDNVFGSVIAAPVVGAVFNEVLPYLGIQPHFTAEELARTEAIVPNLANMGLHEAQSVLRNRGLDARVIGNGGTVLRQIPIAGQRMNRGSTVFLYTEEEVLSDNITLPDVRGLTPHEANTRLVGMGLNIELRGAVDGAVSVVADQWPLPGEVMATGDLVVLHINVVQEEVVQTEGAITADNYQAVVPAG
ncbi:MAG: penicillin-binding transpeptidase domain-containing protein [Oscillospiraceae bacterium]|nr:penicillin-binding transpeptidase domain-containing protein [Oscillospiraceae bacterium]